VSQKVSERTYTLGHFESFLNLIPSTPFCKMAITILPAVVEDAPRYQDYSDSDESMSDNSDSDVEMGGVPLSQKRARFNKPGEGIVTPGQIVTDDPQWMRYASSCLSTPRAKHRVRGPVSMKLR